MVITVYQHVTGEIRRQVVCPEASATAQCGADEAWLEGAANDVLQRVDATQWPHGIVDQTLVPYAIDKSTILADGIDQARITGLPAGVVAVIDGVSHTIDDGELVFSEDLPGVRQIRLSLPLYMDAIIEIEAI